MEMGMERADLVVGERQAKGVGEEEDHFVFGVLARRSGDVALDVGNFLGLACGIRQYQFLYHSP